MPFEKFSRWGKHPFPRVSITARGILRFNRGAVERFGMDRWEWVVLYYDPEAKKVGIAPAYSEDEEGARRLRRRGTGAEISAKSFLEYWGLLDHVCKRYVPDYSEALILLDLTRPTGPRERQEAKRRG